MKKGAIFDMDGLMFDTEAIWQKHWRRLAEEYGYTPSEGFGRDVSGTSGQTMIDVVEKYYPGIDAEAFIRETRSSVERDLEQEVPQKPGLFDMLDALKSHGVKMAVASSSHADRIRRNLSMTGTEMYFEVVLSSTQVSKPKPEPDVFLEAARQLGLSARDCYVFEDSFGGVRAGAAAGSTTIMIPDQLEPTAEIRSLASGVYASLSEAAEAILADEI